MIAFWETYKKKKFYSQLIKSNDLCFDIGANIGKKSKLFLALNANVIAFEPQSQCAQYLNKINSDKFTYLPFAVGYKNETKLLNLANHIEVATLSKKMISHYQTDSLQWSKTEKVQIFTLDKLIDDYGKPDFCKIDTEGFELEILSALNHTIPLIEFEFIEYFIDDTLKIIQLFNKENILFNFTLNEKPKFELSKWVNANTIINIIKKLPLKQLHGNIYIKTNG